jgi:hypothetical protein
MELFSKNPFNPSLRTHKLTGKLEGLWAFSVAFDCRVIFKFLLLLFNTPQSLLWGFLLPPTLEKGGEGGF